MALLIIILVVILWVMFSGSSSDGGSNANWRDDRSEQQRFADEFEMDSFDDEQHWGDND